MDVIRVLSLSLVLSKCNLFYFCIAQLEEIRRIKNWLQRCTACKTDASVLGGETLKACSQSQCNDNADCVELNGGSAFRCEVWVLNCFYFLII